MNRSFAAIAVAAALFLSACTGAKNDTGSTGGSGASSGTTSNSNNGKSSCSLPANALASSGHASATIYGQAVYEDRTYDSTGFTGTACLPVRYATIEVISGTTVVASGQTDAAGNYSIPFTSPGGTVYLRALTQTKTTYNTAVEDDRSSSVYAVRSPDLSIGGSETWRVNLVAGIAGAGQAFNIFDNIIKAQSVVTAISGATPPLLTVYWYDGKSDGTFFNNSGSARYIHLCGGGTDPNKDCYNDSDAYDDSVILHESGHYVADVYSKDTSAGGNHSLTGHYGLELVWSEGWAGFWSGMARAVLGESNPELYVDTQGTATTGFTALSWDISTPTFSSSATGANNELAVSNVLWNIYATGASPKLGLGYADIWNVFTVGLPQAAHVSFETFYDKWVSGAGRSAAQLAGILANRSINYYADSYEPDDSAATAHVVVKGASEKHTFFPAGDKDWFAIDVTAGVSYTFSTGSLEDGADTMMTLYDTNGVTQLAQNDDATPSTLSSSISYTATATKRVYILVEPYRQLVPGDTLYSASASNPPPTVEYGAYTFTVQ